MKVGDRVLAMWCLGGIVAGVAGAACGVGPDPVSASASSQGELRLLKLCRGEPTCNPPDQTQCCNSAATCDPSQPQGPVCCVPDDFPPDFGDATACCSQNGLYSGGLCQPAPVGATSGGTTGTGSGGTGGTGGTACTGQQACTPGDPTPCCDSQAECSINDQGLNMCCVVDGAFPDNGDATACCSNQGLDSSGACAPLQCAAKGANCADGATCCDNTLSCTIEPSGSQVCCAPDGLIPADPADCCSQSGLSGGDGGTCAPPNFCALDPADTSPHPECKSCVSNQAICFNNQSCCGVGSICENVVASGKQKIICCVPFGGISAAKGADCCPPFTVNANGTCGPAAPLVLDQVPNLGGGILSSPKLVTINFPGTDQAYNISPWADWIVGSSWMSTVGKDYGVGTGTHIRNYELPTGTPVPTTDAALQTLIDSLISAGTVPAPTANTYYQVILPADASLSFSATSKSCTNFLGYHSQYNRGGFLGYFQTKVTYGTCIPCTAQAGGRPMTELVQSCASHELLEAATDPNAWSGWSDNTSAWRDLPGEVGDLCAQVTDSYGSQLYAERIWSNSAAKALQPPCVPQPSGETYVLAYASANGDGGPLITVPALKAYPSLNFTVSTWVVGPTPAQPYSIFLTPATYQGASALIGSSSLAPGQTTNISVTVPAGLPKGTVYPMKLLAYPPASYYNKAQIAPVMVQLK